MVMEPMRNCGEANGWRTTPDVVKKCVKLGHTASSEKTGRCLITHTCRICNYTYRVDSGG